MGWYVTFFYVTHSQSEDPAVRWQLNLYKDIVMRSEGPPDPERVVDRIQRISAAVFNLEQVRPNEPQGAFLIDNVFFMQLAVHQTYKHTCIVRFRRDTKIQNTGAEENQCLPDENARSQFSAMIVFSSSLPG